MKKIVSLLLCIFFLQVNAALPFKDIVMFGDSLSDNGNLYRYTLHFIPKSPPYFKGRFSNGPTWVELLASQSLTNKETPLIDYAVGGAGAVLTMKENLPYTLKTELSNYLYLHKYKNKKNSLFVIWIGSNNYINGPTGVEAITTKVVNAIVKNTKNLIEHNAKTIMFMNLPDLGRTPKAKQLKNQALLTQLSQRHNEKLYNAYLALKDSHPDVTFLHYNTFAKFDDLLTNPGKYAIEEVDEPCYLDGYVFFNKDKINEKINNETLKTWLSNQGQSAAHSVSSNQIDALLASPQTRESILVAYQTSLWEKNTQQAYSPPADCSKYLFWDHIHPTAIAHRILASDINNYINSQLPN